MPSERSAERVPNIRDVAARAGVSYQTVSRVLNDGPNIREDTRQRVLSAMLELDYRPNAAAQALATSRSRVIGILAAQLDAFYGPTTAINAIEREVRLAGYRSSITSLASSDSASIKSALDHLLRQSVEAIVIIAPQVRVFDAIEELAISVPYITLNSPQRASGHNLSVDQIAGARLATRHLIELGHTEIVHISGPKDWIEADARMTGFLQEVTEAEVRTRAPILGDWTANFGYYAGLEMLRFRDFSAVFASNDQMALGFIHACRELGLDVPGDVSVVGFDDVPDAAHFFPPLTTVRQDFAEVGRRTIATLLADLRGGAQTIAEAASVAPQLIVRESTRHI
jgi:DNA-binding LacI/PurR family transcriptional regulator